MWKDIPGYEGVYSVSNYGRVKSYKRFGSSGGILKPRVKSDTGHLRVSLSSSGRVSDFLIHRLVLTAFVRTPEDWEQGLHGNGDPTDNRLWNLRWGSSSENHADMLSHNRGVNNWAGREECFRGHPLTPDNTYTPPGAGKRRVCRACQKMSGDKYRTQGLPDDSDLHATVTGYRRGCRCDECILANREYNRAGVKRRREASK